MASNKQTGQATGNRLQAAGNSLFFVFIVYSILFLGITQLPIKPKDKFLNTSGGYNPQFAGLQIHQLFYFILRKKKEKKIVFSNYYFNKI